MRRLIRWAIGLVVMWCLYWGGAAFFLRQAYQDWFTAREAQGWHVEYADLSLGGFPLSHRVRLDAPALADPFNGTAWSAEWLQMDSPAIWPGHQTMTIAPSAQRISYFDQTATLIAQDMQADLRLNPGLDLQLSHLGLTSGAWSLTDGEGQVTTADGLEMTMAQDPDAPQRYAIRFDAPGFAPSDTLRQINARSQSLPESFDALTIDATVVFDRAWDLRALEAGRPQPRRINLKLAEAAWGNLLLRVAGEVQVDQGGIPTGQISLKADNWRDALVMARDGGLLPAELFSTAEQGLSLLAQMTGGPDSLDVQINLRDGFMAVGIIPIGPAPRLILR